ncbi:hypothetical protein GCM10012289_67270 [Nonomuraea cavernae]|uniref:Uncharacterized protein n=1 Tax=Nonomuraea cavernae TaxID=2045107 RepID=A0A917ZEQ4_9ACTN|nr:hypothetical protein GCM10012289_67270 [Nonomuraea cavernae]
MIALAAACVQPPARTPAASTSPSTPGISPTGTVGSLTPVPVPGPTLPPLAARPARCAQPPARADRLRARPVRTTWRAVFTDRDHGGFGDLAVGGDGAVWTTHFTQRASGGTVETAFAGLRRWDGARWRAYPLPDVRVTALGATSAEQAWVFGLADGQAGLVGGFQHGTFVSSPLTGRPAGTIGTGGTAARGAWAVNGTEALSWDGSTWRAHELPAPAGAVGGEDTDVWTVSGPLREAGPAARWNGSAWQRVGVPELGLPPAAESPRIHLNDVAVLGPRDVWAVGGVSWLVPGRFDEQNEPLERHRPVALHWDGHGWRCDWGSLGSTFAQAEPDGRGGLWVLDSTGSRLLRHSGGRWTSQRLAGQVAALAWRPGTAEIYAAGAVGGAVGGELTRATLWRSR